MDQLINKIIQELEYKKIVTRTIKPRGKSKSYTAYLRNLHNLAIESAQKIVWQEFKKHHQPIPVEPKLKHTHYLEDNDLIYENQSK